MDAHKFATDFAGMRARINDPKISWMIFNQAEGTARVIGYTGDYVVLADAVPAYSLALWNFVGIRVTLTQAVPDGWVGFGCFAKYLEVVTEKKDTSWPHTCNLCDFA